MPTVDLDSCLMLVADRRRRSLIQQLRHNSNGKIAIDDLVTQLHHEGTAPSHGETISREHLITQLYHNHLPKLADHEIVEYDSKTGIVRYQPNEQIEVILDALSERVPQTNL